MSSKNNNQINIPQAREAMDKNMCPIGNVKFDRQSRTSMGHMQSVAYMIALSL